MGAQTCKVEARERIHVDNAPVYFSRLVWVRAVPGGVGAVFVAAWLRQRLDDPYVDLVLPP